MKKIKMTKWDAGNCLVSAADALSDCVIDLKDFPKIQKDIKALRKKLSKIYDKHEMTKEMGFGI